MNTLSSAIGTTGLIEQALLLFNQAPNAAYAQAAFADKKTAQSGGDILLGMLLVQDQGWSIQAHAGRLCACDVDGSGFVGDQSDACCSE